ncbi:hypothetical protein G8V07_11500 [Clostridium botulinum D/C]|uniref:hypothetical protein n=1 Tax=Clostridium botulinum TaxID=1491 RepID=UPI001E37238A|nr:hypothetical protein [Clostridium botulinum]MCD3319508.1 hypothetical protein [Clostridium botulinum D/C]MCD3324373.1 hypothetical protein [Clostridium botulinum D/C]MCD3327374.1 hypothetical protein [Clostridium botulinum D/C]
MNFKGWYEVEEKNAKGLNLYCKAHLKRMGLKPKKESVSQIHKVRVNCKWRDFEFYKLEDAIEIKKKIKTVVRDLEITPENLCKSLYVINKSAKKSRDTKQCNYYKRNYGIVDRCKTRQNELYTFKNDTIDKMIDDKILILKGYHIQRIREPIHLLYYVYKNYGFHVLEKKELIDVDEIKYLGEIGIISSESTRKTDIKYTEAIALLKKYIG